MKTFQKGFFLVVAACLVFQACASLGVPVPKTFNERLAAGYTTVTANRQLNTTLINSRVISADDGENVQKQNDLARVGLDIASTLTGTAAEDKLTTTITVLDSIKAYLESKRVK